MIPPAIEAATTTQAMNPQRARLVKTGMTLTTRCLKLTFSACPEAWTVPIQGICQERQA